MTWIAISGREQAWVCPETFKTAGAPRDLLLARGTIMIETRLSPEDRPQTLLSYRRRHPWEGSISVQAVPGGGVILVLTQGEAVFHTVLQGRHHARTDVLRVTYSWDSERRFGRIAVEQPESDNVEIRMTPPPPPLMLEDIHSLTRRPQLCQIDPDVIFFAVSDCIEPIGPMPSVTGQTPVLTPRGYCCMSQLQSGDTLRTARNGVVPVLMRVSRRVPALGSFQPVRLRAPYFGLLQDIVVAPTQRLVISGTDVEYLFGREAVLVAAGSLVNGYAAVLEPGHLQVCYHHLLLPSHEPLVAAGLELESLYVGRLRRHKVQLEQSLLRACPPGLLPEHARLNLKVLRSFETITLTEARAA